MAIKTRGQLARDDSNYPVGFNYLYTNATSANVKTSAGFLHGILSSSVGNIVIYDSATATNQNTIANLSVSGAVSQFTDLNITAINGIYVTIQNAGNVTFIYV